MIVFLCDTAMFLVFSFNLTQGNRMCSVKSQLEEEAETPKCNKKFPLTLTIAFNMKI